jgi:uncharacterized cupredoxin-like copper-binding protein
VGRQRSVWRPIALRSLAAVAIAAAVAGCDAGTAATPAITPGTVAAPREVNVIAKDYSFLPSVIDLVPGETVELHVLNGGVLVHEAVFGGPDVQAAWEAAEAAVADPPPGPTPTVTVAADVAGLRVVATSGQRVDITWVVPIDGPATPGGFLVGCHIPGHYAQGMVVPVRWVGRDGRPLESPGAAPSTVSQPSQR